MKIYVACIDGDMTMRSSPWPRKAFKSKDQAESYLKEQMPRETGASLKYLNDYARIYEIELVENT